MIISNVLLDRPICYLAADVSAPQCFSLSAWNDIIPAMLACPSMLPLEFESPQKCTLQKCLLTEIQRRPLAAAYAAHCACEANTWKANNQLSESERVFRPLHYLARLYYKIR